ncbi:hypothetical protein FOL47_003325 [Perkinsus chesapeaki]|uniref:Uncharacterized protein n=1 Tax=Perkinsus chesapeaki TaxID=330153 RepID=A0A7J6M8N5_PERCH|nr:hypothetical protein FOL47_003325 [Perkinsus chesapeaki]
MTGLKGCGDPKYSVDIGKYEGMREGVRYDAYVYGASSHTFSVALTFTTDAGPYTCRSDFHYDKFARAYTPDTDGCLDDLLAHIGLPYLLCIVEFTADDSSSSSVTLNLGRYKTKLSKIEDDETLKEVDHSISKTAV